MDLDDARRADATGPFAAVRAGFDRPQGVVYLDGNSLGPQQRVVRERVAEVLDEWRDDLIAAWFGDAGWLAASTLVGARIARHLGATPSEVAVCDSTSTNLFKLLGAALMAQRGRQVILTDDANFPTDRYVAKGVAGLQGYAEVRVVPPDELVASLGRDVAVLTVGAIDFRTGARHDLPALATACHEVGALLLLDVSHAVGAIDLQFAAWGVDLAVGCTYKYLSGGPGSPAFLYVADRHASTLRNPVAGWFGHARPFDFADAYVPAPGAARFLNGTPPMLSMAALEAATRVLDEVAPAEVEAQSHALTGRFLAGVDELLPELEVLTPRAAHRRGAQVSLRHDDAAGLMGALADAGVVGDFRPPDILRFGFSPWNVTAVDVHEAVLRIRAVLDGH